MSAATAELEGALRQARAALRAVEDQLGLRFPAWSEQAKALQWIDALLGPEPPGQFPLATESAGRRGSGSRGGRGVEISSADGGSDRAGVRDARVWNRRGFPGGAD